MNIKPYWAEMRMSAWLSQSFGLGWLIGTYALRALRVAFLLLLWRSLFQNGGTASMTLVQTLQYTLCAAALETLLDIRTPAGSWLHDGAIATRILRPLGVLGQLAADTLGAALVPLGVFVPLCAVTALLMGVPLTPLRHVPAAIPLRLENQYFSLDLSHPLATEMLQSGTCMFYVPGMLGEPELELFAVLRT